MADLVPSSPTLYGSLVKGKDQSQMPSGPQGGLKPAPNIAYPTAGPAFGQAPRSFNPSQTAFVK